MQTIDVTVVVGERRRTTHTVSLRTCAIETFAVASTGDNPEGDIEEAVHLLRKTLRRVLRKDLTGV